MASAGAACAAWERMRFFFQIGWDLGVRFGPRRGGSIQRESKQTRHGSESREWMAWWADYAPGTATLHEMYWAVLSPGRLLFYDKKWRLRTRQLRHLLKKVEQAKSNRWHHLKKAEGKAARDGCGRKPTIFFGCKQSAQPILHLLCQWPNEWKNNTKMEVTIVFFKGPKNIVENSET